MEKFPIPRVRFDAFTDAVFAIAMTIMVLELRIPGISRTAPGDVLRQALFDAAPILIAYLLSFIVLSQLWINHSQVSRHSEYLSRVSGQLNLLFLLFVCLVPFPTSLMGEFGMRVETLIPLEIVITGASVTLGLLRRSVIRGENASPASLRAQTLRTLLCGTIGASGIIMCALFGAASNVMLIISLALVGFAPLAFRFFRK
jgi:uncharacterized membrane protein